MVRHRIVEWKQTDQLYVAVIQSMERFEPGSIREHKQVGPEVWLVGRLKGTVRPDLYALCYRKIDLEYEEARARARATLDRYNQLAEAGKDPLKTA